MGAHVGRRWPRSVQRGPKALVADDELSAQFSRVLCPAVTPFAPLSTRASGSAGRMSVADASFSGARRLFSECAASHLSRLALYRSPALMASQSGRITKLITPQQCLVIGVLQGCSAGCAY